MKSKVFALFKLSNKLDFNIHQYSHDLHCTGGMAHLESAPPSISGARLSVQYDQLIARLQRCIELPAAQCTLGVFLMNLKLVHVVICSCTTDEGYCTVAEMFGSP